MQNRYAADIGDYVKLAMLRSLRGEGTLGVAWWLHPDEGHNSDGKHVAYLERDAEWADLDPWLFATLGRLVCSDDRSIAALQRAEVLPNTHYISEPIPLGRSRKSVASRTAWLDRVITRLQGRDIIFVDPDNGIDINCDRQPSGKCVSIEELRKLRAISGTLVVYHHHRRDLGTHENEIRTIRSVLRNAGGFARIDALRARRFSPRVFFLLDADDDVRTRAQNLAVTHPKIFEWRPDEDVVPLIGSKLAPWSSTILTLYPEMFPGPLGQSLAGRALADGIWSLDAVQIRDFTTDKHRSVDDTPAGGGAGMVMRADVLALAVDHALDRQPAAPLLAMTPRGRPLTQALVRDLAAGPGVSILCGRFEGIDERLFEARPIVPISVGDYILSGGETAAIVLLDACIRLLPGVMGAPTSGDEESFESGLLEYPHYTRPQMWEGRTIPEVLRSGDHAKIAAWRKQRAEADTRSRRPDLMERHGDAPRPSPSDARHEDEGDTQ